MPDPQPDPATPQPDTAPEQIQPDMVDKILLADLADLLKQIKAGKPLSKSHRDLINKLKAPAAPELPRPEAVKRAINANKEEKKREGTKAGRPTAYDESFIIRAHHYFRMGCTEKEAAAFLGITPSCMYKIKKKHPEFVLLQKQAKNMPIKKVEIALFQKAIGYSHPSEKIMQDKFGTIIRVPTIEHYPPDTAAASLYLRNRDKEHWTEAGDGGANVSVNVSPQIILTIPAGRAAGIMPTVTEAEAKQVQAASESKPTQ